MTTNPDYRRWHRTK